MGLLGGMISVCWILQEAAFPWWLNVLSIFLCTYWSFMCILLWGLCSDLLTFFPYYSRVLRILFCVTDIDLCWIYILWILSPSLAFHFLNGVFRQAKVFNVGWSPICQLKEKKYLVSSQHWNNKVRYLIDNYS